MKLLFEAKERLARAERAYDRRIRLRDGLNNALDRLARQIEDERSLIVALEYDVRRELPAIAPVTMSFDD